MVVENRKMQQRRDTASDWVAENPTLFAGEIGFEIDTGFFKIGDGVTPWGSLSYASRSIVAGGTMALQFDDSYHQHVNHGYFWRRDIAHSVFLWEAWANAEEGAEYIISDGYGGAHNLLWGPTGMTDGYGYIGQNVDIDGVPVEFGSRDNFYAGDWHHHCVTWDGKNARTYLDGVLSKETPMVGERKTNNGPQDGVLFVGGSDHSNFKGMIRNLRGFEGVNPLTTSVFFIPEQNFKGAFNSTIGDTQYSASFLADYSTPASIIADLSDGYTTGIRQQVFNTVVAAAGITTNGNAKCVVTAAGMTNSPKTVNVAVDTTNHTTAALIAAAMRTTLAADVDVAAFFTVAGTGAVVRLIAKNPVANDATMNVTIEDNTSVGITDDTTATIDVAGVWGERMRHSGYLASQYDGGNTGGYFNGGTPTSGRIANLPQFVTANFAAPSIYRGSPAAIPVGAVGYDDFSRANVTYAWNDALSLGTNRTGQLWTGSWGIIDAHAYANVSAGVPTLATFDLGKAAQDVMIYRKDAISYVGPVARYTDDDNYLYVNLFYSGAEYIQLIQRVAGVETAIGGVATGGAAQYIRLVVSGTAASVYINLSGSPIITGTTSLSTGNKVGMRTTEPLLRVKSIVAY